MSHSLSFCRTSRRWDAYSSDAYALLIFIRALFCCIVTHGNIYRTLRSLLNSEPEPRSCGTQMSIHHFERCSLQHSYVVRYYLIIPTLRRPPGKQIRRTFAVKRRRKVSGVRSYCTVEQTSNWKRKKYRRTFFKARSQSMNWCIRPHDDVAKFTEMYDTVASVYHGWVQRTIGHG